MSNNIFFKIYDFISFGRIAIFFSALLCIISCSIISLKGFNWGLDFTGGMFVEITSDQELDIIKIRNSFIQSQFKNSSIQYFNNSKAIIIRLPLIQNFNSIDQEIKKKVLSVLYNNIDHKFFIQKMSWIGPSFSKNLIKIAIKSILISLICIFLYVLLRFNLKSSVSTIISLINDTIIILGVLSIFSVEINSTVVVALISAIGYSLNDKIVIFDRIRENFNCISMIDVISVFNISLSQVLHRTIITSVTTIAVLLVLLIFGGTILYEFSVILLLGITIGTISSIYFTSFLAFTLKMQRKNFKKKF